jgi:hypothetical protein
MSANSLTIEMTQDLYRLMLCLASADRQSVLFDRLSDEDEELEDDGITEELAMAGISWWKDNEELIKEIADMFTVCLLDTAVANNLAASTFFESWKIESWSDFISETFDCVWNFGDEDNFEYFFDYAVKQSLGFNTGSQEGQDSYGARGVKISETEWSVITKLFQFWWKRKDVFEIFALIHEKTIEGRNLVNT